MTVPAVLGTTQDRHPIASWRHTLILMGILLALAIRGAMFQAAGPDARVAHNVWPLYAALLTSELVLVYAVMRGIRRSHTTLSDLVGDRWLTAKDVAEDVVRGIAVWGVLLALAAVWARLSPVTSDVRSISPLLPQGPAEIAVWIALSIAAGVAEEIVFRGYFQRQFEALTQSKWIALALQAVLFGVSHGYQGVSACLKITLIGALFGAVALWRRSLRPGMIAHAWTDIASGVFRF